MEFFDLMNISHRYMDILNPSTSEKIIKLGKLLKLKKGNRVIDFGCGCAEPLILWAEEFGITGIGIDISEDFCDRARKKLAVRGLSDQIEIVCSPAADYVFEEGAFDAATCIGATFVFGGYQQTIQAMKRAVHQNGRLGIGETHWLSNQVHPEYAQKQATTHTEPELTQFLQHSDVSYVVCGGFGGKLDPAATYRSPSSIWFQSGQFGFADVSISGNETTLKFRDPDSNVVQSFTIIKH